VCGGWARTDGALVPHFTNLPVEIANRDDSGPPLASHSSAFQRSCGLRRPDSMRPSRAVAGRAQSKTGKPRATRHSVFPARNGYDDGVSDAIASRAKAGDRLPGCPANAPGWLWNGFAGPDGGTYSGE
jgi:hypothetical protein